MWNEALTNHSHIIELMCVLGFVFLGTLPGLALSLWDRRHKNK